MDLAHVKLQDFYQVYEDISECCRSAQVTRFAIFFYTNSGKK